MNIAGVELNGYVPVAALFVPVLTWAIYVTHQVIRHGQWIQDHMLEAAVTATDLRRDLERLETCQVRIEAKLDAVLDRLNVH